MSLGALDFGFCDVVGKARPFAESEVDKIVETGDDVGDKVDTPQTNKVSMCLYNVEGLMLNIDENLPSVAVAGGETHVAVGKLELVDESAELATKIRCVAHGAVPVTHNSLCYKSGKVVVVTPADTFHGNGNVGG